MRLKDPILNLRFLDSTHVILSTALQISVIDHFSGQVLSLLDFSLEKLVMAPSFSLDICPLFINLEKSQGGLQFVDIINSGSEALMDPRYLNPDYKILGEIALNPPEERVACTEVKLLADRCGELIVLNLSKY